MADETPGFPDLGGLVAGFQKMQEAQGATYEGQAGGGVVKITSTGTGQFESVEIAKEAVDPDDVQMLEDLVLAALHDLSQRIAEATQDAVGTMDLGGFGDILGGLGLGPGDDPG